MLAASGAREYVREGMMEQIAPSGGGYMGLGDWVKSSPVQWLKLFYVYRFFQYVMKSTVPQVAI